MPFAFSTLGCPDRSMQEVLELATSTGVSGLELRAAPDAGVHVGLDDAERARLRTAFEAAGMRVLTVASYLRVCDPGDDGAFVRDAVDHLRLAADLGASYVRTFPGSDADDLEGDARAVRRLSECVATAKSLGVRICLETHDSHPRGSDISGILHMLDQQSPAHEVEVVWDALHPWRAGETPESTLQAIGPWLAYVQIKDADDDGVLRKVGDGRVPLDRIAAQLPDRADRWWSLEWEKLWHPEIADLPEALEPALAWYRRAVSPA